MKAIKIFLAIFVLAAICTGIFLWVQSSQDPAKAKAPENQFTKKIQDEIEQLKGKPDNAFCKEFYSLVTSHINDFYKPLPPTYPYGRFGNNQMENDQWKENLESQLYSAYAEKFIAQAKFVLRGSAWKSEDLKFIQAEKKQLEKSKLLKAGSLVDIELSIIQKALNQYNTIVSFIASCQSFSYSNTDLFASFPISEAESKILEASNLINTHLGNDYVNKCTRLHDELGNIPQILFKKHIGYLDSKINFWSEKYSNYYSHSEYTRQLFNPIKSEIDALDDETYNVDSFNAEYQRLLKKWNDDNVKAYNYDY